MKTIALLHYAYPPSMGGVEILMQEQAHVFSRLGYDTMVLTGSGEEENSSVRLVVEPKLRSILQQDPDLQQRFVGEGIVDDTFLALTSEIKEMLTKHLVDRDVVIVHNMATLIHNLPFLKAFKEYVSEHPEKRIIIWAHDQTYIDEEQIKWEKEGVNLSEEQKTLLLTPIPNAIYITISRVFSVLFAKVMNMSYEEVVVIPNGINMKRFFHLNDPAWDLIQKEGLLSAYPLFFSPVNILQRKNLLYSLEVIGALKKQYPKLKYVITGKPSIHRSIKDHYEELVNKIEELELTDSVVFLKERFEGPVTHSFVNALYSLADGVFYFSKTENFGLPILESMLLKTPIFTSNLEVFKEIGEEHLPYIDYKTVSPKEAAEKIISYFASDNEGLLHAKVRREYDLQTIIEEKLIPLFS